jgi:phage shock protein PspC (stress-responsive transcriptional regulator)
MSYPSPPPGGATDHSTPGLGDELRTLRRSGTDRVVAGVLGGLGRQIGIDPIILRVATAVLAVFGGVGFLLYAIAWLLVPADGEPGSILDQALGRSESRDSGSIPMAIFLTAVVLISSGNLVGGSWDGVVLLILAVAGFVALTRNRGSQTDAHAAPYEAGAYGPYEPYAPPAEAAYGAPHPSPTPPADDTETDAAASAPTTPDAAADTDHASDAGTTAPVTTPVVAAPDTRPAAATIPAAGSAEGWPEGPDWGPYSNAWSPYDQPSAPAPGLPPGAPSARPPRPRSILGAVTVSAALLAVGVLAIQDVYWASVPAGMYVAVPLAVVGIGLLIGTWFGRSRGLLALGIVLALALVPTTLAGRLDGELGDAHVRIASLDELPDERVRYGGGNIDYDLSAMTLTDADSATLELELGVGNLHVVVPPSADVTITGDVSVGDIRVFDQASSGVGRERTFTDHGPDGPGGGTLTLDLEVGVGEIEVTR